MKAILATSILISASAAIPSVASAVEIKVPTVSMPHISVPHVATPRLDTHVTTPQLSLGAKMTDANSRNTTGTHKNDDVVSNHVGSIRTDASGSNPVTGPAQFSTTTNNQTGNTSVQFGDGTEGQAPLTGVNNINAAPYRVGNGSVSNTPSKAVGGAIINGGATTQTVIGGSHTETVGDPPAVVGRARTETVGGTAVIIGNTRTETVGGESITVGGAQTQTVGGTPITIETHVETVGGAR
jgi:hypothetical protein